MGASSLPRLESSLSHQIRGLVLGLTALLIGFPLIAWGYFLTDMVPSGHTDFRANYAAGYMLRARRPLYDYPAELETQNQIVSREQIALPFIHPAYEALVYAPLSFLPYLGAYWVWFGVNVVLLALLYRLLQPELESLSPAASWLPIATLFAYLPFGAALVQGQDSLLLVVLLARTLALLRKERLLLAGISLGLGVFRFQLVLPVVLCFVLWRQWKLIAGFAASAIPAALLSLDLAGFSPYVKTLREIIAQAAGLHQSIAKMPNLRGLIESAGGDKWFVLVISALVLAGAVVAGKRLSLHRQLSLAIVTASLVSYHCFVHDLSVLFIPCAVLFARRTEGALAVAGFAFCAPVLLIFAPNHFYLASLGGLILFGYLATASHFTDDKSARLSPVSHEF